MIRLLKRLEAPLRYADFLDLLGILAAGGRLRQ